MKRFTALRRVLCAAIALLLLAMTAVPALAASNDNPGGAYVVTANKLNLRSGAYGSIVKRLPRGTVVVYKGQSQGWWKVQYSGGTGYIDRRYVTSVDSYVNTKFAPVCNLYVRTKASANSYSLGKMKKGLKVTLIKQKGSWMYIDYKGRTGWVASKYMKKV